MSSSGISGTMERSSCTSGSLDRGWSETSSYLFVLEVQRAFSTKKAVIKSGDRVVRKLMHGYCGCRGHCFIGGGAVPTTRDALAAGPVFEYLGTN